MISIQGGFSISPVSNIASIENPPVGFMISPARHLHFWFSIASFLGWLSICHVWLLDGMWVYWRVFIGIANLRYPAKSWILCWLVDNPIDTKRLVRIKVPIQDWPRYIVERYHLHISATCQGKYQDPFMASNEGIGAHHTAASMITISFITW